MNNYKINLIPGDGIGVDVVREGCRVMNAVAEKDGSFKFSYNNLPWSCQYYLEHGRMMPEDGLKILRECDAILLDDARVTSIPEIDARCVDATLNHEATVGKIAGEQLLKLMTLGLTEQEAEDVIIKGYLK
jgi:isocitrate/isopropylmalate dehydrogenase